MCDEIDTVDTILLDTTLLILWWLKSCTSWGFIVNFIVYPIVYRCLMHPSWWSPDLLLKFVELMVEWQKSWDDIHGKEERERERDKMFYQATYRNQSYFAEISKTKKQTYPRIFQNIGEQCSWTKSCTNCDEKKTGSNGSIISIVLFGAGFCPSSVSIQTQGWKFKPYTHTVHKHNLE